MIWQMLDRGRHFDMQDGVSQLGSSWRRTAAVCAVMLGGRKPTTEVVAVVCSCICTGGSGTLD